MDNINASCLAQEYKGARNTFIPKVGARVEFLYWQGAHRLERAEGTVVSHCEDGRPNIEVQLFGRTITYGWVQYGEGPGRLRARSWKWLKARDESNHGVRPPVDPNADKEDLESDVI